ncbi:MAG TPA: hypothetical protein VN368_02925 [Candidatus Methylomirabilis sp.]|nr:hypothetical protein [Candidatus Methylomirabilis sp.]
MGKDGRMHGVIKNKEMQERIKDRMKFDNLTFEELLEKYLTYPEDACDAVHKNYRDVEDLIVKIYGKNSLKELMEVFWNVIINCAKGNFDINLVIHNMKSDIQLGTYKKKKS